MKPPIATTVATVEPERFGGISKATQVGYDHCMGFSELGNERQPHVTGLRVTVQEKHRFAFASDEIVNLRSVYFHEAAFDSA
jgi:hypothetical protein